VQASPDAGDDARRRDPWWRSLPLHPLLFAAYPVLFLFAANIREQLSVDPMLAPLVAGVAGTLAVLLILRLVFRDWLRAGLATSVMVGLFFSYGHVRTASFEIVEGGIRQRYLLAGWALMLVAGMVVAWRIRPRALSSVTTVLNVIAAVLVVMNTVPIVAFQINGLTPRVAAQGEPIATVDESSVSRKPDIYYLIFDRYARADTLRDVYGFDNTAFLEELERRGFYVASESNANYYRTVLSLASSLDMSYHDLDSLRQEADSPEDLKPFYRRMERGQSVEHFLKSLGYTYVRFGSQYQASATSAAADINVRHSEDSEFANVLLDTTLASAVASVFPEAEIDTSRRSWEYSRYQFEQLEAAAALRGPKFVFAHFTVPHPPFVFDRDGNFIAEAERTERGRQLGYTDMVRYANKRILEFLDVLQAGPEETRPVILIQSDEGPYPRELALASDRRWDDATRAELHEKYRILNAYYLPGGDYGSLYPSISPVNSFRVVFNEYFGTDLELLPDRSYAPFHADRPYDEFEITDVLRSDAPAP